MTRIAPLTAADLAAIAVQPGQRGETGARDPAQLLAGPAWAARDGDGRVLACGGFAPLWPGHFYAWADLAAGKRHALVAITRQAQWWMRGFRWRRLTTYARADWPEAHRWCELLGFRAEGFLPAFGPAGEDFMIYGRVNRQAAAGEW